MSRLKCLTGHQIPLLFFLGASALDKLVFSDAYQIPLWKGVFWAIRSRQGYVMVYDTKAKKVVAYLSLVSLKKEYYEKMRNGTTVDINLPLRALCRFRKDRRHLLYVASVVIHPDYRRGLASALLANGFNQRLLSWAEHGIYVDNVLADAVSDDGRQLCDFCGLTAIGQSQHSSTLYEGSILPMAGKMLRSIGEQIENLYAQQNTAEK